MCKPELRLVRRFLELAIESHFGCKGLFVCESHFGCKGLAIILVAKVCLYAKGLQSFWLQRFVCM